MTEQQNELQRRKRRSFTQVDNEISNNEEISWQAKGMLLYLLSKPDGWVFYETDLVKRATNGRDSVRAIIKELLDYGYLKRGERIRNKKGHLGGYKYTVEDYLYESYDGKSYIGKSYVGKTKVGNPYVGKSDTSNTESFSNTKSSSNTEREKKENPSSSPSLEDKNFQVLQNFFDEHIGKRNFTTDQELSDLLDEYKDPLLIGEALKIAAKNGKPLFSYSKGVLRKMAEEKGVKTYEQFLQRKEQAAANKPSLEDRAKTKPTTFGGHQLPF